MYDQCNILPYHTEDTSMEYNILSEYFVKYSFFLNEGYTYVRILKGFYQVTSITIFLFYRNHDDFWCKRYNFRWLFLLFELSTVINSYTFLIVVYSCSLRVRLSQFRLFKIRIELAEITPRPPWRCLHIKEVNDIVIGHWIFFS